MKDSKKLFKHLGFIGVGLCAACCLFPIVSVLFAMGAFTFLTRFLEWAGIAAMVAAAVFFGIYFFKNKKFQACDVECTCKDENEVKSLKS
jgi:hypothetical protein